MDVGVAAHLLVGSELCLEIIERAVVDAPKSHILLVPIDYLPLDAAYARFLEYLSVFLVPLNLLQEGIEFGIQFVYLRLLSLNELELLV